MHLYKLIEEIRSGIHFGKIKYYYNNYVDQNRLCKSSSAIFSLLVMLRDALSSPYFQTAIRKSTYYGGVIPKQ